MPALIQLAATAGGDLTPLWDAAKAIGGTVFVTASLWTARTVFVIRDDVREMKQELFGRDGTNGMRSVVRKSAERLDLIDARHIAMDAVAEAERDLYEGDDKRHRPRRLADHLREKHQ